MSESTEPPGGPLPPAARTYLAWSLAATALCFLPLGVVALVYGLQASRANAEGRFGDAGRAGRIARRWLVATAVVGVLVYLFLGAVLALLGAYSP